MYPHIYVVYKNLGIFKPRLSFPLLLPLIPDHPQIPEKNRQPLFGTPISHSHLCPPRPLSGLSKLFYGIKNYIPQNISGIPQKRPTILTNQLDKDL